MTIRFIYTGIRVRDLKRSEEFYRKVLGMKVILRGEMAHGGKYVHLRTKSAQRLELNWYPQDNIYHRPYKNGEELDHLAFWVDDVEKRFREVVEKGAEVAVEPFRDDKYLIGFVKDPDGVWIELMGLARKRRHT